MTFESNTTDIVIAGGSYVGLALALALSAETGGDLKVAVVAPALPSLDGATSPDVRGSALSRGSLHLLDRIGVWDGLRASAETVTEIVLTDSALDDAIRPEVLRYSLGDTDTDVPRMVIVENGALGRALHAAARVAPGVRILERASIIAATPDADGMSARLDTADQRTLRCRLLVAADGRNSSLRSQAGIATTGWAYEQTGIVTIVTPELPHQGRAVQHFLPAGPFALLPMTRNRICVTWTEDATEARRILALDAVGFRAEVERRFGGRLGALIEITRPQSWPLELGIARQLTAQRFAVIGDAAHTLHPIAGQGLNLGLRDVAALAEAIVDTARLGLDIGAPACLDTFERARRFDNFTSAAAFDVLNRAFSVHNTLARSLRGAVLGAVDRLDSVKQMIIAEAAGETGNVPRLLRARPDL